MPIPEHVKRRILKSDEKDIYINLNACDITVEDIKRLVSMLKTNPNVTGLNMQRSMITNEMIGEFEGLPLSIKTVNFCQNHLDDGCIDALIKNFKNVPSLDISYNNITNDAGLKLCQSATQTRLKIIGNHQLSKECMHKIHKKVEQNRSRANLVSPQNVTWDMFNRQNETNTALEHQPMPSANASMHSQIKF